MGSTSSLSIERLLTETGGPNWAAGRHSAVFRNFFACVPDRGVRCGGGCTVISDASGFAEPSDVEVQAALLLGLVVAEIIKVRELGYQFIPVNYPMLHHESGSRLVAILVCHPLPRVDVGRLSWLLHDQVFGGPRSAGMSTAAATARSSTRATPMACLVVGTKRHGLPFVEECAHVGGGDLLAGESPS